jgi:hypothetical protein
MARYFIARRENSLSTPAHALRQPTHLVGGQAVGLEVVEAVDDDALPSRYATAFGRWSSAAARRR